ncbi:unnamed protein product, partial [Mesorhabditis belari]|uniref:Phosphoinositide phospholipase C n=1 Tax=Mesorhabditis belari TaxID=2138241 RepID=A0AAF3E9S4_9BILA
MAVDTASSPPASRHSEDSPHENDGDLGGQASSLHRTSLALPFANRQQLRSSLIKHGTRGKNATSRKTVSFCSQRDEKRVSNVSDCWQIMQNGTEMVKLRGNVRQFRRFFSLDADLSYIRWHPTNKKPHKARICVDEIREIRVGRNTELLRASESALADLQEECAFSIIYGEDFATLDLVAVSADHANIWVTGLIALTQARHNEKPSSTASMATLRERWLETLFDEIDAEKSGMVNHELLVQLIIKISSRMLVSRIRHKMKEILAANGNAEVVGGKVSRNDFVELYKEIATRPEIYFLMVRYANKDYLSCQDLRLFLETEQGMMGVTTDYCERLIEQFEPSPEGRQRRLMTVDGFTRYLLSPDCSVFDPSRSRVWMDMKQPFARYFIATSNRAYLVEDQAGPASADGYASALKRGCRVLDVDIWDPVEEMEEREPHVAVSALSPNRIPLPDTLRTIRECAFEITRYPLFLRLSLHCSVEWQKFAVSQVTQILNPYLYDPRDEYSQWDLQKCEPSPWDFLNKIIIIGKKLNGNEAEGEVTDDDENLPTLSRGRKRVVTLCREASDLIAPFSHQKHIGDLLSTAPNSHTLKKREHQPCLNEATALRLMHTYQPEFMQATRDYAIRVIPNTNRVDSSNLNPQEFWNCGVQMVALNYQTPGLMMDLQEGKFSENGGCGYVLKPSCMLDELFVPGDKLPTQPQVVHLRIVSGQQLPRPRGSTAKGDSADPFVVVEMFGVPSDCAEERTRTIKNDSVNPCWDESFQFQVSVPEVALVRFLVLDDDFIGDDFIGQYTLPFDCLQAGYRHIHLRNNEGDPLENATLFVHIAVTNRRGGGKAKRRGMSVKRKAQRAQTGIKLVGIKSVDDQFKEAVTPLTESIDMRTKLEEAMVEWQEECGLGPAGTIRQGIRLLHSRIASFGSGSPPTTPAVDAESRTSTESPIVFHVDADEKGYPLIVITGQLPEQLSRPIERLCALLTICGEILTNADSLLLKIEDSIRRIQDSHDDLERLAAEAGLRGLKATRANENFTWNLRLLKAQLGLMGKSQDEARGVARQVFETGAVLGVLAPRLQSGRRFSTLVPNPHDVSL